MEFLNKYGAAILTAIAALVVVILLCIVFWGLKGLVPLGDHALPACCYRWRGRSDPFAHRRCDNVFHSRSYE